MRKLYQVLIDGKPLKRLMTEDEADEILEGQPDVLNKLEKRQFLTIVGGFNEDADLPSDRISADAE